MSTEAAPPEQPQPRPSGRELAIGLLVGLIAGGLLVYAAGRTWRGTTGISITGRQLDDVPYALGLVGLAGTVAVLAAGRYLRPVVGVLLALSGAAAGVTSVLAQRRSLNTGFFSTTPQPAHVSLHSTAWPWVSLAAGVLLALVGVAVVVRGNRWPGMGRRYEAPGSPDPRPQDPDLAAWSALDRGEDPTRSSSDGAPLDGLDDGDHSGSATSAE